MNLLCCMLAHVCVWLSSVLRLSLGISAIIRYINTPQSHDVLWVVWLFLKSSEQFTGMIPSVPAKFWSMCRGRCCHLAFIAWEVETQIIWMGNIKCMAFQHSGTGNEREISSTSSINQPISTTECTFLAQQGTNWCARQTILFYLCDLGVLPPWRQ